MILRGEYFMKHYLVLFYAVFSTFLLPTMSSADSATATQTLSITIPEVNLLDMPEMVYVELQEDGTGYYSGEGQFTYAITANTPNASTTKRIMANIAEPNFGEKGRLVITMVSPSTLTTHSTVFQHDEGENKTLVTGISNVAKKDVALSIALEKLSFNVIKPYINPTTLSVQYPIKINYSLSYD